MKIPNAEHAIVDIRKLRDYCLNPHHNKGKHKARLFASLLGMNFDDAEELRNILLETVKRQEAQLAKRMPAGNAIHLILRLRGKINKRQFGVVGLLKLILIYQN